MSRDRVLADFAEYLRLRGALAANGREDPVSLLTREAVGRARAHFWPERLVEEARAVVTEMAEQLAKRCGPCGLAHFEERVAVEPPRRGEPDVAAFAAERDRLLGQLQHVIGGGKASSEPDLDPRSAFGHVRVVDQFYVRMSVVARREGQGATARDDKQLAFRGEHSADCDTQAVAERPAQRQPQELAR